MDERAFSVAIDGFAVHDLPLSVDVEAEKRIRNALDSGGMLLVGEIHGAAENALVLYTLARRFDVTTVGLEWPPELTPAVSAFLAGGPVPHAPIAGSADGRITAGHFAVLRKLHSEGRLHQAVMFSRLAADRSWSDRDSDMASRLLAEVGDQPALVFAGNLHTSLVPHRYGVPMGVSRAGRSGGKSDGCSRRPSRPFAGRPRARS